MSKIDTYPQINSSPRDAQVVTGTTFNAEKKVGMDVNVLNQLDVTGEFTVSGLKVSFRNTTMDVTSTAVALPATPLTNRNTITIQNKSLTDTLYIGPDNLVTADSVLGTTSGMEIGPGESWSIDITDQVVLYGIVETGKTIRIKVTEAA